MKDSTYPDLGLMLLLHVNLYFTVLYFWTAILQLLAADGSNWKQISCQNNTHAARKRSEHAERERRMGEEMRRWSGGGQRNSEIPTPFSLLWPLLCPPYPYFCLPSSGRKPPAVSEQKLDLSSLVCVLHWDVPGSLSRSLYPSFIPKHKYRLRMPLSISSSLVF